jgi:hypothetical protein
VYKQEHLILTILNSATNGKIKNKNVLSHWMTPQTGRKVQMFQRNALRLSSGSINYNVDGESTFLQNAG